MKKFTATYISCLLTMLAIDAVWLTVMGRRFYPARIGHLLADRPAFLPAGVFYLVYNLGPAALVVVPAIDEGRGNAETFLKGGLLGLVAYGTYDLTNQATLKGWPSMVTLVDLAWGAALTGAVSTLSLSLSETIL